LYIYHSNVEFYLDQFYLKMIFIFDYKAINYCYFFEFMI